MKRYLFMICLGLMGLIAACSGNATELPPEIVGAESTMVAPTLEPTATPEAPGLLLINSNVPNFALQLETYAEQQGYQVSETQSWQVQEWPGNVNRVIGLWPTDVALANQTIAANSEVQFLIVGDGISEADNAIVISPSDEEKWNIGFVAGYTAAVLSAEWRTGLAMSQEESGLEAIQQGFVSGTKYYCGLCSPLYPPFLSYPIINTLPASSDTSAVSQMLGTMTQNAVESLFLVGFSDHLQAPADFGQLNVIGLTTPGAQPPDWWHATLEFSMPENLEAQVLEWLNEDAVAEVDLNWLITIASLNDSVFTPGRLENVNSILPDLYAGIIAP